ncbi:MAG: sensor histidine kinase [Bacilli bacterium]
MNFNKINQVLLLYIALMSGVAFLFIGGVIVFTDKQMEESQQQMEMSLAVDINSALNEQSRLLQRFVNEFYVKPRLLDDLNYYFSNEYDDYIVHILDEYGESASLYNDSLEQLFETYFLQNESLKRIQISDIQSDQVMESSANFKVQGEETFTLNMNGVLKDPTSLGVFANVTLSFDLTDTIQNLLSSNAQDLRVVIQRNEKTLLDSNVESEVDVSDYEVTLHNESLNLAITVLPNRPSGWIRIIENTLFFIFAVIAVILIFSFVLYYLLNKYYERIQNITSIMKEVEEGNLDVRINDVDEGDLQEIASSFNEMVSNLQLHIEKVYTSEIKQKDAEMRALQSQINPHFLYNTLEYIRMYAVKEGLRDLGEMTYILGTLFRNNMTGEKEQSVEDECYYAQLYLDLFQLRFPGKFAYQVNIQDEAKSVKIPKFTLQPLIENYVIHGIDFERKNNAISITVTKNENKLTIVLRDNGKGIPTNKYEDIQKYLKYGNTYANQSIGIKNVHERLRIHFQEKYSIQIQTEKQGVKTTLEIYVQEDENV